jgi:ligand-binding sensor domain-containing protein
VALLSTSAPPATHGQSLHQLYHRSWTVRDGAPGNVTTIAQAADGFLWLGTDNGLVRFDGESFEPYHLSSGGDLLSGYNVRQKDPALKEVVEQLSRGNVRDAMEKLDAQGRVHEIP